MGDHEINSQKAISWVITTCAGDLWWCYVSRLGLSRCGCSGDNGKVRCVFAGRVAEGREAESCIVVQQTPLPVNQMTLKSCDMQMTLMH